MSLLSLPFSLRPHSASVTAKTLPLFVEPTRNTFMYHDPHMQHFKTDVRLGDIFLVTVGLPRHIQQRSMLPVEGGWVCQDAVHTKPAAAIRQILNPSLIAEEVCTSKRRRPLRVSPNTHQTSGAEAQAASDAYGQSECCNVIESLT